MFEINPGDPALEERGPCREFDYTATGSGKIFIYAVSEGAPLFLCLWGEEGEVLAKDDGEGGVRSPSVQFAVVEGQAMHIAVAAAALENTAQVSLNLFEAPETAETLTAAKALRTALKDAYSLARSGDRGVARQRLAEVVEASLKVNGAMESAAVQARLCAMQFKSEELGDLTTTRAVRLAVHTFSAKTLPDDHPDLQKARGSLAGTMNALGDLAGARVLQEQVLECRSRTLLDDHPDLQRARGNLAGTIKALGDLAGARLLEEQVLEIFSRTLPKNHPNLQVARNNLAATMFSQGDLQSARALQEQVLEVNSQTLPDDHPVLQKARLNLALTIKALGDLDGARVLQEQVLEVFSRTLPDDHPSLQKARLNLAGTIKALGDFPGARELEEQVLEVYSRILPDDHPNLQLARGNLAATMYALGDFSGTRALQEQVLEIRSRILPDDHPDLQTARSNLAGTMYELGDLAGARALFEQVLEIRSRILPEDHPDLQTARSNLAGMMYRLGDLAGARLLQEQVLETNSRTLPDDHPNLQAARMNFALTIKALGDLAGARLLQEQVLEVFSRTLPDDHSHLQLARGNLATVLLSLGELGRVSELGRELGRGIRERLEKFEGILAPREVEAMAFEAGEATSEALTWIPLVSGKENLAEAFCLIETVRAVGVTGTRIRRVLAEFDVGERTSELREEIQKASTQVVHLTREESETEDLFEAVRRKDRLERALREQLAPMLDRASALPKTEAEAIAPQLEPIEAAVGYWRYERIELDQESGKIFRTPSFLAFVLRPGEAPQRIELGQARLIEDAVSRWRQFIGKETSGGQKSDTERGTIRIRTPLPEESPRVRGEELRRLIFDPLLPAIGDAKRIIVALDDVLHLVPLDALPMGEVGGRSSEYAILGDSFEICVRSTLKELTLRSPALEGPPSLLALGGIDYNGAPLAFHDKEPQEVEDEEKAKAPLSLAVAFRGAPKDILQGEQWKWTFAPLPSTGPEAEAISEIYAQAFPEADKPWCFKGAAASRDTFEALASKARFLHIATHGYFAPESVPSMRDKQPKDERLGFGDLRDQVRGFAPMVLCGLALAGANARANDYGRVSGLMTAEEIAGLDLSRCELCVLSACDTNVGIRRAGQGIASMQQALWGAGVRSAITSLWKVPDEATRELMTDFYQRLWIEKKPKAKALWEAKCRMRRAKDAFGDPKYSLRDWAGWVLTGNPQ